MALIVWNEKMSVGVKALDAQHKNLIDILNELNASIAAGQSEGTIKKTIERLIQYTKVHFSYEEKLLHQTEYPEIKEHGRKHDEMITEALSAQALARWGSDPNLAAEMNEFLQRWLTDHILGADKRYMAHLHAHGIS